VSSPCSVPHFLRPLLPKESAALQRCCTHHDEAYHRGGTYRDWCIADAEFLLEMLREPDIDPVWADNYYQAVRGNGWQFFGRGPITFPPAPYHVEAP
jgi:hypothetical protein